MVPLEKLSCPRMPQRRLKWKTGNIFSSKMFPVSSTVNLPSLPRGWFIDCGTTFVKQFPVQIAESQRKREFRTVGAFLFLGSVHGCLQVPSRSETAYTHLLGNREIIRPQACLDAADSRLAHCSFLDLLLGRPQSASGKRRRFRVVLSRA
jgi:hypothetical protein